MDYYAHYAQRKLLHFLTDTVALPPEHSSNPPASIQLELEFNWIGMSSSVVDPVGSGFGKVVPDPDLDLIFTTLCIAYTSKF
jgi:hypothetical protein